VADNPESRSPLFVILLLALLAGVLCVALVPVFVRPERPRRGNHGDFRIISNLKTAIDTFEVDNHRLPRDDEGFDALLHGPPDLKGTWVGPYVQGETFLDAWGHPLRYVGPSKESPGAFNIIAAGRDGVFGTADDVDLNTTD
jgi:type II secretion system protein G